MSYPEYDYEYDEIDLEPDRRRIIRIVGLVTATALIACICILCIIVVFAVGYGLGGQTRSEPTSTITQSPEPVIVFAPEAKVGEPVTFDGSQSRPGTSPIASYEWDFGDGTRSNGTIVTHVYNAPATYQVTLTVTGQDGSANTGGPVPIAIRPPDVAPTPTIGQLPEPVINLPTQARVGEEVVFDGSQSRSGSSPIATYEWDFGDGARGSGEVVAHIYNAPGTYQVTLSVTGQDGFGNTAGPVQILIVQ